MVGVYRGMFNVRASYGTALYNAVTTEADPQAERHPTYLTEHAARCWYFKMNPRTLNTATIL